MSYLRKASLLGSLADLAGICLEHAAILLTVLLVLSPCIPLYVSEIAHMHVIL